MLTQQGAAQIWRLVSGDSDDRITSVRVSNTTGDTASVAVRVLEIIPQAGSAVLRAHASFGEFDANFEWQRRELVTGEGVVIDATAEDFGRKVLGAVWDVEIDMTLGASDG